MPGVRQRLAARSRSRERARTASGPLGYGPELSDWLLEWSWGDATAAAVVRRADAKAKNGCRDETIRRLSRTTANICNAERVVESLMPARHFPPALSLEGSIKHVILPYESFHWLAGLNRSKFETHFGANEGMTAWWRSFRSSAE